MATVIYEADQLWKLTTYYGLDISTASISVRLVTSGYTPDIQVIDGASRLVDTLWDTGTDDATDPSFSEASAGSGYSTGGIILSGWTATNSKIYPIDITWPALTKTFRGALGVYNGTLAGLANPLLFYLLPDSTPADIVSTGSDYQIAWNATDGLFYRPAS